MGGGVWKFIMQCKNEKRMERDLRREKEKKGWKKKVVSVRRRIEEGENMRVKALTKKRMDDRRKDMDVCEKSERI